MSRQCIQAIGMACKDWKHEKSISICSVLALASMLAPLLALMGLKNGIIEGMRERLLEDPSILIITPKSDAGRYAPEFIARLNSLDGAAFAIGRTRETATDITLAKPGSAHAASVALEPSAPGEPVLARYGFAAPSGGREPQIVLSTPAAQALQAKTGDLLDARIGRRAPDGRFESAEMRFRVAGTLPLLAAERKMAFVDIGVLEDLEDYRDYLEVPERGFAGNKREGARSYASFRLYAQNLDSVEALAARLSGMRIETRARDREIAAIRLLSQAINQVILIISLAVGAGFIAFTISSVQGAVERKRKMLGMLRLFGFSRTALVCYPLTGVLLTASSGLALSFGLYFCVAAAIARAFSGQAISCRLSLADTAFVCMVVLALSLAGSLRAAIKCARVEPSGVIREV